MPVFYHVVPSDIRSQTGQYWKAFQDHEKEFEQEEIEGWKKAPREELLNIGSNDVQIVGIHGLGGIDKTTIARCVYNRVYHRFEGWSFIADAHETFQQRGLVHLQRQLVINILNVENPNISSVDQGIAMINQRLSNKKVLIVLIDEVDQNIDLNAIIGKRDWFGFGSRIIITTRDKHILDVHGVDGTYEPNEMHLDHSLQLFNKHAFKMDQPLEHYLNVSKEIVKTTRGLPLALKVIGSFLFGKEESAWKDTVKKLKNIPHEDVQQKLRISYDGLNYEKKEIFLDIACFFIGMDKNVACYIWHGCDFFPEAGIENLHLKSLVKVGEKNELMMHDQLQDLGREIIHQGSYKKLEERSRLLSHEEALKALSTPTGTRKVEGLYTMFKYSPEDRECMISSKSFAAMIKLRLLQVDYVKVAETLEVLNLSWCDKLSQPPDLSANLHLEVLILEYCSTTIGSSIGHLKSLIILNLKGCKRLKYLPTSIWQLSSLKTLDIRGTNICQLPETLGSLEALTELYIDFSKIQLLSSICHLRNLKTLSGAICRTLEGRVSILHNLPELPSSLKYLDAFICKMKSFPTLSNLTDLETLCLHHCKYLVEIPTTINALTRLESLG
ncbi:disease resistance protein Roq1-like [Macadamia integrifolia]|uniref:disease resistance protein Roq1-like n=1 Tax=Macadamia integrifolia TaxID=60698 RepID=UPI001C500043|nr:disease resistance protein Roq1-like [Macadamia integrifolia]